MEREARRSVQPSVKAAADEVRRRLGPAVVAVLFYGSCLRTGEDAGRVIDLYVLVADYRSAYPRLLPALLNALLPPNVYHLEVDCGERTARAKYAVVSLKRFLRDASRGAGQPDIWGRFAQPTALVYASDEKTERAVIGALADAVETLVAETAPLMPVEFTPREFWTRAFSENYRSELRAERPTRADELYAAFAERYDGLSRLILGAATPEGDSRPQETSPRLRLSPSPIARWRARLLWRKRRFLGKPLSVLRLAKAAFTFDEGADYILWKIEEHSGVRVSLTPWQKRHPLLTASLLFWRLYRRGAFH